MAHEDRVVHGDQQQAAIGPEQSPHPEGFRHPGLSVVISQSAARRNPSAWRAPNWCPAPVNTDDLDVGVVLRDLSEHREGAQRVAVALHDQRRAGDGGQRRLVVRPRPLRRGDRMAQQHQGSRRLDRRQAGAHASTERAANQRHARGSLVEQSVADESQVVELWGEIASRPPARKRHRLGLNTDSGQLRGHRSDDGLRRGPAVSRREHRRQRQSGRTQPAAAAWDISLRGAPAIARVTPTEARRDRVSPPECRPTGRPPVAADPARSEW